jgi:hypothetical protein
VANPLGTSWRTPMWKRIHLIARVVIAALQVAVAVGLLA